MEGKIQQASGMTEEELLSMAELSLRAQAEIDKRLTSEEVKRIAGPLMVQYMPHLQRNPELCVLRLLFKSKAAVVRCLDNAMQHGDLMDVSASSFEDFRKQMPNSNAAQQAVPGKNIIVIIATYLPTARMGSDTDAYITLSVTSFALK